MRADDRASAFLARWAHASQTRDVEAAADLFLRDPAPIVTFSDGQRVRDWLDVRIRLERDLGRNIVERVVVHDVVAEELAAGVLVASFVYDLHVRDMWGMEVVATRLATMSLVETKDGLRIASAHFSAAR